MVLLSCVQEEGQCHRQAESQWRLMGWLSMQGSSMLSLQLKQHRAAPLHSNRAGEAAVRRVTAELARGFTTWLNTLRVGCPGNCLNSNEYDVYTHTNQCRCRCRCLHAAHPPNQVTNQATAITQAAPHPDVLAHHLQRLPIEDGAQVQIEQATQ